MWVYNQDMIINSQKEENILKEAGEISVNILKQVGKNIKEGITPLELDNIAGELCRKYKVKPNFKKVEGYHFNTCISVNDVAVHGIPNSIPLKKGDLVSIDFGIVYKGFNTDHCWTWSVGQPSDKNRKLLLAGRKAVENCLPLAITGNYTGDLGYEMERVAKENGFNVLRMFVGHGIGKSLHEEPDIPAYGRKHTGTRLITGMVICIECQVVDDDGNIKIDSDGWSARTSHGGNSVMFEYMVIVDNKYPTVLTNTLDWDFIA